MAYLVLAQQDAVGLATFTDDLHAWLVPSSSPTPLGRRPARARANPASSARSNIPHAISMLASRLKRRGLIVIISDFIGDSESLIAALKLLKYQRHDVLMLHTLDSSEVISNLIAQLVLWGGGAAQHCGRSSIHSHRLPRGYAKVYRHVASRLRTIGHGLSPLKDGSIAGGCPVARVGRATKDQLMMAEAPLAVIELGSAWMLAGWRLPAFHWHCTYCIAVVNKRSSGRRLNC